MSVPRTTPDVLAAVLREVSFTSAAYRWIEMGAPFRLVFDRPGLRGVHLIASGECDLVLAGREVTPLAAGDTVILPRGDDHELRHGHAANPTSGFELAGRTPGAHLRGGGPGPVAATIVCGAFIAGDPGHPALGGLPRLIVVPGEDGRPPAWLAPYVEVLRQEAFDAGPGSDVVMARLSDALIARALRATATDHPGWLAGLRDPHLAAALGALHADPAGPWTLRTLAAAAGLSRTAFTARFAATVGEPPMGYLRSLRLHRARRLLRDERLTVAVVAARVGYGSEVAFAAAFRRAAGMPPGEWRRQHPEGPGV
ncbi:AraC family transcriptional regulator [Actinoplanes solisilvae]|uniref:AraC family transcriptional regulator n=1 Tax=Actinoplanes solisilvae TaxID=2486853 RepID=UPI000FDAE4A7|nr:AraC family transcriptional regulator [Actinoplanes solisilvae]